MSDRIFVSGTLSPDGNWLWNGSEWIPAPPDFELSSQNDNQSDEGISEPQTMSTYEEVEHTLFVLTAISMLIGLIVFAYIAFSTAAEPGIQPTASNRWEMRGYFALVFAVLPAFWTYRLNQQWNEKNQSK